MKDEKALGAAHTLRKYCRQHNCADCIFNNASELSCFITDSEDAPAYWDFAELDEKVNGTCECP